MNIIIESERNESSNRLYKNLKRAGAISGLLVGLIFLITSAVLWAVAFFENENFDKIEVGLIILSFLLLGFGSHFLDLLSKKPKAANS